MDKNAVCCNVEIVVLIEPNMLVNSSTFVEPTFKLRSICTNHQHVVAIKIDVVCDIVRNTDITTLVIAYKNAIEPNVGIAIYAIELNLKTLSAVCFCHFKMLSIPANTGFRVKPANRFIAMSHHIKIG